jgi:predicted Fe-Mo cluster-binding NifX family protein
MKIAIASTNQDLSGEIYLNGGRAPYYLIVDEKGELLESIKNPFAVGGGGAGFGVSKMLADKGVDKVVVGEVGENMKSALKERNLSFELAGGLIEDYLK